MIHLSEISEDLWRKDKALERQFFKEIFFLMDYLAFPFGIQILHPA